MCVTSKSVLVCIASLLQRLRLPPPSLLLPAQGIDEVLIATIMHSTLEALQYVHRNGGIHRDIKVCEAGCTALYSSACCWHCL